MHTKVVFRAAKALAGIGCAVLRFNFRGVGRSEGAFADGDGEADDFRAAVAFLAGRHPGLDLWAGGFSFGAWIASRAASVDPRISTYVGIGLTVNRYEFAELRGSGKPKFLIHGERDEICPLRAVRVFYGELTEPKELVVIDGADHLFDGRVSEVGDAIGDLLADYHPPDGASEARFRSKEP